MNGDELDILFSDGFRSSVEASLGRDPLQIALDRRVPHAALVASQVKYLRRAESKLPSYYAARCILPPRAFEQSSSEATAARKNYSGGLAIDLTCGLGVDAFWLSQRFERVIALERDSEFAAIARENFRRLGADNIIVINTSAEEFLTGGDFGAGLDADLSTGLNICLDTGLSADTRADLRTDFRADLVYADPDRRGAEGKNEGKKMVRIEDCSPDIVALLPQIEKIAPRLVVKLSPLFDVDEVFRVFGPNASTEVVSLGGECKEIIADVQLSPSAFRRQPAVELPAPVDDLAPCVATVRAVAIGMGEVEYPAPAIRAVVTDPGEPDYPIGDNPHRPDIQAPAEEHKPDRTTTAQSFDPERYLYLIVPDVALQKARLAKRYFSGRGVWIDSDNGYGFATAEPGAIMGKVLEIESIGPFDPKELKRRLRAQGTRSIDILKRDFPLSTADITRQLGVREGGTVKIAFTRAGGRLWQITLKA